MLFPQRGTRFLGNAAKIENGLKLSTNNKEVIKSFNILQTCLHAMLVGCATSLILCFFYFYLFNDNFSAGVSLITIILPCHDADINKNTTGKALIKHKWCTVLRRCCQNLSQDLRNSSTAHTATELCNGPSYRPNRNRRSSSMLLKQATQRFPFFGGSWEVVPPYP